MPTNNKQIHLDNRPQGEAAASNFKLVTAETPAAARTARCWCATTS